MYFIYKDRISLYISQFLDRNLTEKKPWVLESFKKAAGGGGVDSY